MARSSFVERRHSDALVDRAHGAAGSRTDTKKARATGRHAAKRTTSRAQFSVMRDGDEACDAR
jgi:hypothetical protein